MAHTLTVKIPESLLHSLRESAESLGVSVGAVVRQMLELGLRGSDTMRERITRATEALRKGRAPAMRADWKKLRELAAWKGGELPEDEVRRLRRRGL